LDQDQTVLTRRVEHSVQTVVLTTINHGRARVEVGALRRGLHRECGEASRLNLGVKFRVRRLHVILRYVTLEGFANSFGDLRYM